MEKIANTEAIIPEIYTINFKALSNYFAEGAGLFGGLFSLSKC